MSSAAAPAYHPAFDISGYKDASEFYQEHGYVVAEPVLPADLITRTRDAMREVMMGKYETGVKPRDEWYAPGDENLGKLRKIDMAHLANRTIYEAISHPGLGKWVARVLDAKMVQVWTTQLLFKPPVRGSGEGSSVGWHQDFQYWQTYWTPDSEVFTAWLALSDVNDQSGPLCFLNGSHRWGFLNRGDFFKDIGKSAKEHDLVPEGETWSEVAGTMPPGAFSLHHKWTFHASYPNQSNRPRMSFAVHLRTERSTPLESKGTKFDYAALLNDHRCCPVIYQQ